jgi:hypothetical protein
MLPLLFFGICGSPPPLVSTTPNKIHDVVSCCALAEALKLEMSSLLPVLMMFDKSLKGALSPNLSKNPFARKKT